MLVSESTMEPAIEDWLCIVRGEFQEVPGLYLTKAQARRLWGLDIATCDALFDALVDQRFLALTPGGQYFRP
ncbi:MAG: hypothetical protein IT176_00245 [Acidobacteria bacterium]|nr:hypothetical protein [Acidobacteriota bacterium]